MALRPHGRARVDPNNPQMFAKCDKCYTQYNHVELRWQYRYAGAGLVNTGMLVCPTCYDIPNPQERTIILPADPAPKFNQRMENWQFDESNRYTLQSPTPGIPLFRAQSSTVASIFTGPVFTRTANMDAISSLMAAVIQVKFLAPSMPATGSMTVLRLQKAAHISADFEVTSVLQSVTTQYHGFSNFGSFTVGG
jgi:hypothetical protein